jgi:hypothetical protein
MRPAGPAARPRSSALPMAAAVVSLGLLILALHGQSVRTGLFMDDYAHFRQLRECDWSLAGLTAACRLELVGGTIELWWLPQTTLRFFRPVAFGLMKLAYTLCGWDPASMHVVSLAWHWAVCGLLMVLLRRLGAATALAWAVAALFAIHPAHVATVQWIACQTELMVTAFLLGATLCFARFRGWPGFVPATGAARLAWATACVVLFGLALGCRENAVMFPLVVAALEPLVWRQRRRSALVLYAVFAGVLIVYWALRSALLGGAALPQRPYVISPTEPDFARFVGDKALYYSLGEYLLVPCVPIGGLPYAEAHPLAFYGSASLIAAGLVFLCIWYRRQVAGLLGPAWLFGFMLPVLPVFASPHHLYLPGIGWAVTAMLILRAIGARLPTTVPLLARLRRVAQWAAVGLLAAFFGLWTFYFGLAVQTGEAVEDCVAEELAAAPSGLHDGDTLYIANSPVLAHYVRLVVEERTGRRNLRVIPLTWSPRLLGAATPTELTWIDDRTIEVRVADDRYFSGPLGLLVREATGHDIADEVDRSADLGFRVKVLQRDADGVEALRFTFVRPFPSAGLHLFWGSRTRWACEVSP